MTTQKSIADRVLDNLLIGDGCREHTRLGVPRLNLVRRIGRPLRDRFGNEVGWTFADDSEIHDSCGGWDTPEGWDSNR